MISSRMKSQRSQSAVLEPPAQAAPQALLESYRGAIAQLGLGLSGAARDRAVHARQLVDPGRKGSERLDAAVEQLCHLGCHAGQAAAPVGAGLLELGLEQALDRVHGLPDRAGAR